MQQFALRGAGIRETWDFVIRLAYWLWKFSLNLLEPGVGEGPERGARPWGRATWSKYTREQYWILVQMKKLFEARIRHFISFWRLNFYIRVIPDIHPLRFFIFAVLQVFRPRFKRAQRAIQHDQSSQELTCTFATFAFQVCFFGMKLKFLFASFLCVFLFFFFILCVCAFCLSAALESRELHL